jgi:hypothetical protein
MEENRRRLTLNMRQEDYDVLKRMSEMEGRTMSNMAVRTIRQYHTVVHSDESPNA